MKRRDFLRLAGAAAISARPLLAIEPTATGDPRRRELGDIALKEARRLGATYADLRITWNREQAVQFRDRLMQGDRGQFNFGPAGNYSSDTYGFGVRVVHSGTWGFASSPEVTADEVRRVARLAVELARASAVAAPRRVRLAPVERYTDTYRTPIERDPFNIPLDEKVAILLAVNEAVLKNRDIVRVVSSLYFQHESKFLATSEGSIVEQDIYRTIPGFTAIARKRGIVKNRSFWYPPKTAGWEIVTAANMPAHAERVAAEAVEHALAKPVAIGSKDLVLKPSHAALTIHEIVAHPTELDRIAGYEANYAGTSFIKIADIGKLRYGSRHFNVVADRTMVGGMATVGYDDDGEKAQRWPLVREGVLVGVQTNRETAHLAGEKRSRGCTFANHWRNFPFLRMPNVSVEPGPAGSPTPDAMIADVKDGVLIDGMGSFSIDQQRYNGQFGGDAFWQIRNGKVVGMVSDVTYNAITTDFWGRLAAVSGPQHVEAFGLGGDAKGQPVQSNYPSHASPWLLVRGVMVGATQR